MLKWELSGLVFIFIVGSLFHFTFEWVGRWPPGAFIFAVNESVWEHLKLAFWPGMLFALIEYPCTKKVAHNFWLAKTSGLLTMPFVIVVMFYGYTAITGRHYLSADIAIFFISIAIGQLVSYKLLTAPEKSPPAKLCAVIVMVMLIAAFSMFTYYPPHIFLFEDARTQNYGIQETFPNE
ncbi:MAG: hypothetical protein JSV84_16495 [Gemmatimonadota bacterium]|nr:MAG: hypothetical protein JSV84_16495 [Gemmatimonadota bacterium]